MKVYVDVIKIHVCFNNRELPDEGLMLSLNERDQESQSNLIAWCWRQVQRQLRVSLDYAQDLGLYLDKLLAPQPLGPLLRALRKKTGIQDAGSTRIQTVMMRVHEAPYFYGFFVNNAFLAGMYVCL